MAQRRPSCRSRSELADAPRRYLARRVPHGGPPSLAAVHDRLLAAATEQPTGAARRLPFVSLDGTPLVYSETTAGGAFRLLTEPGALDRDVPSQVDFALATLDALVGELGWGAAADDVNAVVRAALPATGEDARTLPGGIGLGVAAGADLDLRVYLDLRGGSPAARWQRVADAFAPFGDADAEAVFAALLERAAPVSVPVGLAAVLAGGALRGLRLYVGVDRAEAGELAALTALSDALLEPFCTLLGPFAPQRVTAAFDFALDGGAIRPALARSKIDACRIGLDEDDVRAGIDALVEAYGLDGAPLRGFLADLDDTFGGATTQYVGVGRRGDATEVTVYAEPAGLERS